MKQQTEKLRDRNGLTEEEFLAQYNPGNYPRPSMTVDMLIFAAPGLMPSQEAGSGFPDIRFLTDGTLKLLLIRRGGHPCLGQYALPGGFVGPDETVAEAARRELFEETHAQNIPLRQLYTFSKPGRDPRTWVMSCAHLAVLNTDTIPVKAGDDADKAEWFTVSVSMKEPLYRIVLSNDSVVLEADIACPPQFDEGSCCIQKNNGLAFDHGTMILCGLKSLFGI